ncbi:4239_t:CDS:2 [Paraglomus brasilianum]|uniref:4239_t:CDS:1 n=1 Tax=Paraglomus brasilianum TaxID=144538 RepID=A0A9N9CB07_9GLOM|nr:4239_t:CDS:2 [Paraglomus brasilianum]
MESFFPLSNTVPAQPDALIQPKSAVDAAEPSSFEAPPSRQEKPSSVTEAKTHGRKRGRKSTKNFPKQTDLTGNEPISLSTDDDVETDEKICTHDLNEKKLLNDVVETLDRVYDLSKNQMDNEANQNEPAARKRLRSMSTERLLKHTIDCVSFFY